jgi:hypothetical protein
LLEFWYPLSLQEIMQAFEVTGTLNSTGQLILDQPLQVAHPGRVRVIVLVSDSENVSSNSDQTDPSESQNFSAQSFLNMIDKIRAQVPDEEWKKLPTNLSKNIDYYLYGSPIGF